MKKILILGAGFLQSFVIKKAKQLGYYTIAVDKNPKSIGFQYADEYGIIDIVNPEECLMFAKSKSIHGVMTAATDYGVLSASYLAQELNLPGINYDSAKLIKNKHSVRKLFVENSIDDISQYYEVNNINDLDLIINSIKYPVMVKPSDGSGSKAAKRVDKSEQLYEACKEAIDASLIKKALIEDFIPGKEFGVESFVFSGEAHVLGILNKETTSPPDYAELGHMMPSGLDIEDKIKEIVRNAIKVLGVDFGAVNMDILVTEDNHICIIDVGARMGGNLIGSHIISKSTRYDYLENLIKASVNDDIDIPNCKVINSVATKILALQPGKILGLPDFDKIMKDHNVDIFFNKGVGEVIRSYHNNLDGCGYVLSVGEKLVNVENNAIKAKDAINRGISRA